MINQLIRYEPAIRLVEANGYARICEIGSGQNGICKFIDRRVTGIDKDFKDYREDGVVDIHPNLVPHRGDILEGTPFADQEFDLVLCVDMLEHLEKRDRERAIREILRIGKVAYIALPIGTQALDCDRWLGEYLLRKGRKPPGWLYEHLDLDFPMEGEIEAILDAVPGVSYRVIPNDNIAFHKFVVLAEIFRFGRRSKKWSQRRWVRPILRWFDGAPSYRLIFLVAHGGPPPRP